MTRAPALAAALAVAMGAAGNLHADPPPASAVTGYVAVTSDYIFRGLTQTWGEPALQGGFDLHAGRWHVGAWTSNVSQSSYPGGGAELDLFGDVGLWQRSNWSLRAGLYAYLYPGANLDHARPHLLVRSLDALEANVALGWKGITLKYNRALTDYFGADVEEGYRSDSRGTGYLQLDAAVPLGGAWSLGLHAGHTHYTTTLAAATANAARNPDYSDFAAILTYQVAQRWSLSGGVTHATNAAFYARAASLLNPHDVRDIGGTREYLLVQTAF